MTAAQELAALLAVLREGGSSVYVGPVPGVHWGFERTVPMSVRLEMGPRPQRPPEEAVEPEKPAEKLDPIQQIEARLFGAGGVTRTNGA